MKQVLLKKIPAPRPARSKCLATCVNDGQRSLVQEELRSRSETRHPCVIVCEFQTEVGGHDIPTLLGCPKFAN